jgi:hypothetical protein
VEIVSRLETPTVVFEVCYDLVHNFYRSVPLALGFSHAFRVSPALSDEVVTVPTVSISLLAGGGIEQ